MAHGNAKRVGPVSSSNKRVVRMRRVGHDAVGGDVLAAVGLDADEIVAAGGFKVQVFPDKLLPAQRVLAARQSYRRWFATVHSNAAPVRSLKRPRTA
ncbi:hypothetical protein ACLKOZ_09395 [Arthrobacter sp. R4]